LLLLVDDYLAIHEALDDVLVGFVGTDPPRVVKDALEVVVLGVYGIAFVVYVVSFRDLLRRTEYGLLVASAVFLAVSLAVDVVPHSWTMTTLGVPADLLLLVEEGAKAVGIVIYFAYYARTAGVVLRQLALRV
jgi:hypothetical protein